MNIRTLRITLAAQALLIVWLALPQAAVAAFTDNGDGTVSDTVTGLMWDKCSQGQSGAGCATGTASTVTWSVALTAAVTANTANYKSYNDWRLPNKNELESLVDLSIATNPTINLTAFPATPASSVYWSSTTYTPDPAGAWFVYFGDGITYAVNKTGSYAVRLVRSGQSLGGYDAQGDSTPNAFAFTDQTSVALSTLITSAPVQISGITTTTNWTASGGTACVSSANDCSCDVAGYAANGTVLNNQYMCARHTSSGSYSTATDTLVTVGGVSDTFTSTTLASYTLTVSGAGDGAGTVTATGINCAINAGVAGGDCAEIYGAGTAVTLTPVVALGSVFAGWSGNADCTDSNVTMDADKICTATFYLYPPATPPPPDPSPPPPTTPQALLMVNNIVGGGAVSNPLTVVYGLVGCQGKEMFLVVNAPAMGIPWSYLNAAGQWIPLPTPLAAIAPWMTSGPGDGNYTLYQGTAPKGNYEIYLGCDNLANGHLDIDTLGNVNGLYGYAFVTVP